MASQQQQSLKIIIGAGGTRFPGWQSFNQSDLDIRDPYQWGRWFSPNSIDSILAEHVWEHLTYSEGLAAARQAYQYLKPGGVLRIAVPDGNHPDPTYIDWVRPGNWLNGDDHKELYTAESLSQLLRSAGFMPVIKETFDDTGNLHSREIDLEHGHLYRSCRSFWASCLSLGVGTVYTSLVIDAFKP